MKIVTLTQLKNNFSALMDLVKKGKTSLLVYDRKTPVIRIIHAGQESADSGPHDIIVARLERAGLLRRKTAAPPTATEIRSMRVSPQKKGADILSALSANREEDR